MAKPKEISWDMKVKCIKEIETDKGDGPQTQFKVTFETEDGLVQASINSAVQTDGLKPGTPITVKLISSQLTMEEFKKL